MTTDAPSAPAPAARALLPLVAPALLVGVVSALVLLGVSVVAERFEDVLWGTLPDALGVGRYSALWMVVMLTATGLAVGIVVRLVHGHAGPDRPAPRPSCGWGSARRARSGRCSVRRWPPR